MGWGLRRGRDEGHFGLLPRNEKKIKTAAVLLAIYCHFNLISLAIVKRKEWTEVEEGQKGSSCHFYLQLLTQLRNDPKTWREIKIKCKNKPGPAQKPVQSSPVYVHSLTLALDTLAERAEVSGHRVWMGAKACQLHMHVKCLRLGLRSPSYIKIQFS